MSSEDVKENLQWFGAHSEAARERLRNLRQLSNHNVEAGFEDQVEMGFEQVQRGSDGLPRALLLSMCPRLRSVNFIPRSQDTGSCLYWLDRMISNRILAQ